MKERLTTNFSLRILALVFAFVFWLLVANVEDPMDTQTFKGVPVGIKNDNIVTSKGKTYSIVGDQNVSVTIKARKSVLYNLKEHPEKITAYADMQNLENRTLIPVEVSLSGGQDEYEAYTRPRNLEVEVEDNLTKRFPVSAETWGTVRDGYMLGTVKADPEFVTIKGGSSAINRISKIVAKADVSGMSSDSKIPAELILYDAGGGVIDPFQFENNLGDEGVSVKTEMLNIKTVKLDVKYNDILGDGYMMEELIVEPGSIQIAGKQEELKQIEKITIPSRALSQQKVTGRTEVGVDITEYLPEQVRLVDEGQKNISVTLTVNEGGSRRLHLPVSSIIPRDLSSDLKVKFDTENVELLFTGSDEALKMLDTGKLNVYINLKDYWQEGVYEVPLVVEGYGDCEYSEAMITITLDKKKE